VSKRAIIIAAIAVLLVGLASWALVRFLTTTDIEPTTPPPVAEKTPPAERRISATVYYVAADGLRLVPITREVIFGATPALQAKHLVEALLEPAPAGVTGAVPEGTTLRGVFVADNGDAFVDFGDDLLKRHPGGSLTEIYTVYAIVHTLTTNLPAIHAVQILVSGHEVDTLAGHVDLRRPLPPSPQWLEPPAPPASDAAAAGTPAPAAASTAGALGKPK
jgi:hypothetical protein